MFNRELLSLLTATYNAATVKPLATYESNNDTFIVYAPENINGVVGYPCSRVRLIATGQNRFDAGFLTTAEDPKSGSATLITELTNLSWG